LITSNQKYITLGNVVYYNGKAAKCQVTGKNISKIRNALKQKCKQKYFKNIKEIKQQFTFFGD